ncbi:MAG: RuvX/YqgF family protein [bacterium]|nr:RuvX/YqgF family protein [bacterium]
MKYLGIDYGSKWVGLALSNDAGTIAFPRAEIENDEKLIPFLFRMIEQEKVGQIIVGDTLASGGAENRITREAQTFVEALAKSCSIPIEFAPEMWSSIEASRYAPKGEEHNNAAAAAVILQRYLEMKGVDVQ